MLTDIILTVVGSVVLIVANLANAITEAIGFVIPDQLGEAWITIMSYAGALNGIFPIAAGIQCAMFLISVLVVRYTIELILFVYHLLPMVGTQEQAELPSHR